MGLTQNSKMADKEEKKDEKEPITLFGCSDHHFMQVPPQPKYTDEERKQRKTDPIWRDKIMDETFYRKGEPYTMYEKADTTGGWFHKSTFDMVMDWVNFASAKCSVLHQ